MFHIYVYKLYITICNIYNIYILYIYILYIYIIYILYIYIYIYIYYFSGLLELSGESPRCSTMELGVYLSTREPREGLA